MTSRPEATMSTTTALRTGHPRRRRLRRLAAGLAAGALLAAGCVDDDPGAATRPSTASAELRAGWAGSGRGTVPGGGSVSRSGGIVLAAALRTTGSCEALLAELKAEALERVGPYGLGSGGWYGPAFAEEGRATAELAAEGGDDSGGGAARASAAADSAQSAPAPAGGPAEGGYSATNTQESGVDEPDLVKTDGRRLVVVSAQTVRVVDVSSGSPVLERTIQLPAEFYGGELFLDGDRALLMVAGWSEEPLRDVAAGMTVPAGVATSRLIELDLTAGRVIRSLEVEGSYLSARDVDGSVRIVVTSPAVNLPFVLPANPAAEESAEAANRSVIERSTIDQWLPAYRSLDAAGNETGSGLLVPCEAVHLPGEFAGFGTVAVLTVDLGAGLALGDSVGVLTDGQTVYASTHRLIVATAEWVDPRIFESGDDAAIRETGVNHSTALHAFDITDPARATYVASGALGGRLVDQFALDEHDGLIRVATTEGDMWGQAPASESFVTVLREAGGSLELVGRVGGLGVTEQIQSVRFLDDVAYVVTFRQTDPFYVVDLADPAAPRVTGELKIPGFSSYLHPLAPSVVLGVGQDATEDGRVTGAQLSLFEVSDPVNPRRIAQLDLGEDTWSVAGQDHRAFLWWAPARLAVLPISQGGWSGETGAPRQPFEGAVVVHIAETGEMTEVGRLSHPFSEECPQPLRPVPEPAAVDSAAARSAGIEPAPGECWQWQPPINRALVIGDGLFTTSDGGVQANGLADLAPRGFAPFTG